MENKEKRKLILEFLKPRMEKHGFKKIANSFLRVTEDGIIQVLDFSLGRGLSSVANHLGFGFGISIQEVENHLRPYAVGKPTNSVSCEIRDMYCTVITQTQNTGWYDLKNNSVDFIQNNIWEFFELNILKFFEKLMTRVQIIQEWEISGNGIGFPPRGRLSIGIIKWYLNKKEDANKLFELELKENTGKPYFNFATKIISELPM